MQYLIYLVAFFKVLFTMQDATWNQKIDAMLDIAVGYSHTWFNVFLVLYIVIGVVVLGTFIVLCILAGRIIPFREFGQFIIRRFGNWRVSSLKLTCGCLGCFFIPFLFIFGLNILLLPLVQWLNWKIAEVLAANFLANGTIADPFAFWGLIVLTVFVLGPG